MEKIIFRVDDRLIHGQVVEGWLGHLRIKTVIIVSDFVANDSFRQSILTAIVPPNTQVQFFTVADFLIKWGELKKDTAMLVLFETVADLGKVQSIFSDSIYINIGCIASRKHSIELSNTVFVEPTELDILSQIAQKWRVNIHKLPWEKDTSKFNSGKR